LEKFELNKHTNSDKKALILIFTEGTVLKAKRWIYFFNTKKYVPIKKCIQKINNWDRQGAQICYLCSGKSDSSAQIVRNLLLKFNFPGTFLYYRTGSEKYKDIVEFLKPNILIEDDCRSIGGAWQMSITHVNTEIKKQIKSIVIKEFGGIDNLPDDLMGLINYRTGKESNDL